MKNPSSFQEKRVALVFRLVLGGLFLVAGAPKILEPDKFAVAIGNYRLLPHVWVNLAAITLPWMEVTTALLLLIGVWVRAGALIIAGLSALFFAAISSALARGLNIECGCFGTIAGKQVGLTSLAMDSVLLIMAAWLVWRAKD